jgi:hypothetical protein
MKTDEDMILEIEAGLRGIRDAEKHVWEKYDCTGDNRFMTVLHHLSQARRHFSLAKELIDNHQQEKGK